MAGRTAVIIWLSGLVVFAAVLVQRYDPQTFEGLLSLSPSQFQKLLKQFKDVVLSSIGEEEGHQEDEDALQEGEVIMSAEELSKYDGRPDSKGLYLALLGKVYDVERGHQYYGPDGGYRHFSGRDGSRSFVTGDFSAEGLTDDVTGLENQDMLTLDNWLKFYEKDYSYVGRVVGRYYNADGSPTNALREVRSAMAMAVQEKEKEADETARFPGCNSEWAEGSGGRLWCSTKSGGIERNWIGHPRKLYNPDTGQIRCVCASPNDLSYPHLREYDNCYPTEHSCPLPE